MKINCAYTKLVPIEELKPSPKNPNKHSDDQINRLMELIEYYGVKHPIIVSNQSGLVVAGHGRLEALKRLKCKDVPVDYQDFESPDQEYGFMVADNAIQIWSDLSLAEINLEIPDLGPDFDVSLLAIKGFSIDHPDIELEEKPEKEPKEKCPTCGKA